MGKKKIEFRYGRTGREPGNRSWRKDTGTKQNVATDLLFVVPIVPPSDNFLNPRIEGVSA
jgi:hypothetical protein